MKKGFTLIELLVVIAIISLLSSVTLATFDGVREDARNTKRLATVKGYITALEFVFDDQGAYPNTPQSGVFGSYCLGDDYSNNTCLHPFFSAQENATLNAALAPYMVDLPILEETNAYMSGGSYTCTQRRGSRCIGYSIYWVMESEEGVSLCAGGNMWWASNGVTFCYISKLS